MTYDEAKREAQAKADASGFDHGVKVLANGVAYCWTLPVHRFRFGAEDECEVVHCTDLSRCRPGHGPVTT